jgi:hypothetical protein
MATSVSARGGLHRGYPCRVDDSLGSIGAPLSRSSGGLASRCVSRAGGGRADVERADYHRFPSASETPKTPSPSPSSSLAAGPEEASGNALGSAPAGNPAAIPDLGAMDVIGNMKYFATDVPFRCTGPTVTEGDNILWSCAANARDGRSSNNVSLVGDDHLTILSVTATVHRVSGEGAASFFSYVADLCLRDTNPLNPEAWMQENVPTGGQVATGGTALSVYGTKEVRTLEVVASGTF